MKQLKTKVEKAATRAAEKMSLAGEGKKPSEAKLDEWADDWWANEGIPTMEYAGAREPEFEDPQYRQAFVAAFKQAMKKRLSG